MSLMAQSAVECFSKNLASLTEEYGAVSRLAEHMEWSRVHMSRVIHGHVAVSMEDAEKIAKYVGYSLSDLLLPPRKFSQNLQNAG